jgi:hypothetical protein
VGIHVKLIIIRRRIQFRLRAESNIQEPVSESARIQKNKRNKNKEGKFFNKLRSYKFKHIFIKILIDLQTTLTAETHSTEGH